MCNNLVLHELMSGSGKGQTEVYTKKVPIVLYVDD